MTSWLKSDCDHKNLTAKHYHFTLTLNGVGYTLTTMNNLLKFKSLQIYTKTRQCICKKTMSIFILKYDIGLGNKNI